MALIAMSCQSGAERAASLTRIADKYAAKGDFERAVILYQRATQLTPRNGTLQFKLGTACLKTVRRPQAVMAFRRAYELQPPGTASESYDAFGPLSQLLMASAFSGLRGSPDSLTDLKEITGRELSRNPGSAEATLVQGTIFSHEKMYADAVMTFRQGLDANPDHPRLTVALCSALEKNGQSEELLVLARGALEKQPGLMLLYQLVYRYLRGANREAEAFEILRRQVEMNPDKAAARLDLAHHYFSKGLKKEAESELSLALKHASTLPGAHRYIADLHYRMGNVYETLILLEEGARLNPAAAEGYLERTVSILLAAGRFRHAAELAERIAREFPSSPNAKAIRGLLQLETSPEAAVTELNIAVKESPANPYIRYALGAALRRNGRLAEAEEHLVLAATKPDFVHPRVDLGVLYIQQRKADRASIVAGEALQLEPNNQDALLVMVEANLLLGSNAEAEKGIRLLATLDPRDHRLLRLQGQLAKAQGRLAQALSFYDQVRQIRLDDHWILRETLDILHAMGKIREGTELLTAELRRKTGSVPVLLALGSWNLASADYSQAAAAYKTVADRDPKNAEAWSGMGRAYYQGGDPVQAEVAFRKALLANPADAHALLYLGIILTARGRYAEARPFLEKKLEASPNDVVTLNNLALVLSETGEDLARALSLARRATAQAPTEPGLRDTLGMVYLKRGLYFNAVQEFEKVVSVQPNNATWRRHLAMALLEMGNRIRAERELTIALQKSPSPAEREEIEKTIRKARL